MPGIIRREWRAYFCTPVGYVFIAIFWLLGAAFFFLYNVLAASADLSALFGNLSYLFMLISPLLTMRLFSEERRQKTDLLYLSSPTPLSAVVAGKFLAALGVLAASLAGTGLYLFILAQRVPLHAGAVAAHYLAFLLLGGATIAVGILMSALTENQITAAVLTLAVNMLLQLAEMSSASLTAPQLPFLPQLLGCIALNQRYAQIAGGVIHPADIAYFIAFTTVVLLAAGFVLAQRSQRRR
ncbi:MAG: ABC transporter permease subunit [Clostridia bacterium]|nr:ABC transporter permease subunit [Clostridia bacterium]